ncbi:antirestriction protein ArdC [Bisgaardia hudsonensis]|uniref:Antirestriction protein ArdC n=1 Tax=Bisgaardia hudsonensis TaxID=109472 RepID=A0A4R2N362_9PAST|nr:zincin-like metallopeptidase domain-containing protein [Bisgaardia hudsonensis]QLB12797.1 antirestriction protein [Bisgaardia hudsonensis]TCP14353.1 antirestriction protein ArdC [Bisgaardia hudsonensis]
MNTQIQHKPDLYQEITDRIIKCLEDGTVPWLKPWTTPDAASCFATVLPRNAVSGRLYSGVNILLLWIAAAEHEYKQCKWITAQAANKLGGHVRKGEKATIIVNYNPIDREKCDDDGNPILDEDGNPEMEHFAVLRRHPLFNIEQCDGLPNSMYDTVSAENADAETVQYTLFAEIRQMIKGMDLEVKIMPSNRAFYRPGEDKVVMPEMKQFNSEARFYGTLLHEMTHATGHLKRLNREGITSGKAKFGNQVYAFEELVAEMGGAFVCAHLGFNEVPQNAAYIESWIKVLKEDKRAIFKASGFARNACEYMMDALNVQQQYEKHFSDAE